MTEQPHSAEAMTLLSEIIGSCGKAGMCRFPPCSCAQDIDALIAQRVAAETERWEHRDRQRLEQIARLQETVGHFQSAGAERPAYPLNIRPDPEAEIARLRMVLDTHSKMMHPWYGPCDGLGPEEQCAECLRVLGRDPFPDPPAPEAPQLSSEALAYLAGLGGYGPSDVEEAARLYPMPVEGTAPSALASTGEQPDFARCLRCVSHELTRDVCGYAGRYVRQATATPPSPAAVVDYDDPKAVKASEGYRKLVRELSADPDILNRPMVQQMTPIEDSDKAADTRECTCHPDDNPPRPCPRKFAYSECVKAAAVVDYTERALTVARDAIEGVPSHLLPYRINSEEIAQAIAPDIAAALSAVASEHQAKIDALYEASRNHEKQAKEAEAALLGRLQEPDVREAVRVAIFTVGGWSSTNLHKDKHLADAAIAKIAEMLK